MTIKQILDKGINFELSNNKYNAVLCNEELIKKEGGAILYRVYKIDERTNTAHCTNTNAWGKVTEYRINTNDIKPYNK